MKIGALDTGCWILGKSSVILCVTRDKKLSNSKLLTPITQDRGK